MGAVTRRFCLTKPTVSAGPRRIVLAVSAILVALAAVCVKVPPVPAQSIAIQANTGDLWILDGPASGSDTGLGMMAGSSPSMNYFEEVAFRASGSGNLWTDGKRQRWRYRRGGDAGYQPEHQFLG